MQITGLCSASRMNNYYYLHYSRDITVGAGRRRHDCSLVGPAAGCAIVKKTRGNLAASIKVACVQKLCPHLKVWTVEVSCAAKASLYYSVHVGNVSFQHNACYCTSEFEREVALQNYMASAALSAVRLELFRPAVRPTYTRR